MNISVLGCGRWGSVIGRYLSNHNQNVILWGREGSARFNDLKKTRANEYVKLNDNVVLTDNLFDAVEFAEIIIISISAQSLRSLI